MCHSVSSEQAPKTRTAAESDYKAHVARQDLFAEIALNHLGIDLDLGGSELDLQQVLRDPLVHKALISLRNPES